MLKFETENRPLLKDPLTYVNLLSGFLQGLAQRKAMKEAQSVAEQKALNDLMWKNALAEYYRGLLELGARKQALEEEKAKKIYGHDQTVDTFPELKELLTMEKPEIKLRPEEILPTPSLKSALIEDYIMKEKSKPQTNIYHIPGLEEKKLETQKWIAEQANQTKRDIALLNTELQKLKLSMGKSIAKGAGGNDINQLRNHLDKLLNMASGIERNILQMQSFGYAVLPEDVETLKMIKNEIYATQEELARRMGKTGGQGTGTNKSSLMIDIQNPITVGELLSYRNKTGNQNPLNMVIDLDSILK